jgi:hypothetical protein
MRWPSLPQASARGGPRQIENNVTSAATEQNEGDFLNMKASIRAIREPNGECVESGFFPHTRRHGEALLDGSNSPPLHPNLWKKRLTFTQWTDFLVSRKRNHPSESPFSYPVMTVLASRIFSGLVFPLVQPGVSRTETRQYASMQFVPHRRVPHTAALTGAEGAFQYGMVCLLHW